MVQEIQIHRGLSHEHVVKLIDYFEDDDNVYVILELCARRWIQKIYIKNRIFAGQISYGAAQTTTRCYGTRSTLLHISSSWKLYKYISRLCSKNMRNLTSALLLTLNRVMVCCFTEFISGVGKGHEHKPGSLKKTTHFPIVQKRKKMEFDLCSHSCLVVW